MEQRLKDEPLLPVDEVLHECLHDILTAMSHSDAPRIENVMLHDGGLLQTVRAVEHVFFAKDGALFQAFADALFDRLRRNPRTWKDRFLLTRLAQSTLGTAPDAVAHSLDITFADKPETITAIPITQQLEQLELHYALNWPVQNVIRSARLPAHTAAFSLLLQVEYAAHLLRLHLFDLRSTQSGCKDLTPGVQSMLRLRTRLLWIIGILRAHVATVADVLNTKLRQQMHSADTVSYTHLTLPTKRIV